MNQKSNNKEIYVTGGAGLIGSYLCERLVSYGKKVFIIDDFSKGQIKNIKNFENNVEIIEADLQNLSQAKNSPPLLGETES